MARIIVIGGIESTYHNVQALHDLGEEIVMFYTRGPSSPGWEGVDMVDESQFSFADNVPKTLVDGHINDHIDEMQALRPDVIYSLGWQQMYSKKLLAITKVVGIHESLLPEGAGAVPIANAILHDRPVTGITLFELDGGMDTGPIIAQLRGVLDPRQATATELYCEAMKLEISILQMMAPHINAGTAPRISQDMTKRLVYKKICWDDWPKDKVLRTRMYPYA